MKLSEEINYSDGAVVSKTIIDKKTGTITVFAFDKGQGLSEHTAPFDAFVNVVDGEANVIIGGKENIVKVGEYIVMPANIPHAIKADAKFKMLLIMIKEQ